MELWHWLVVIYGVVFLGIVSVQRIIEMDAHTKHPLDGIHMENVAAIVALALLWPMIIVVYVFVLLAQGLYVGIVAIPFYLVKFLLFNRKK